MASRSQKPNECIRFFPGAVTVPVVPLLRLQGYRELADVRDDVRAIAHWAAKRVSELALPEVVYRRLPVEALDEHSITLGPKATFRSREFYTAFCGSSEALAFVLTLGPAVDAESLSLVERDDVVEALFLEYAGWIAIERATRTFVEHLQTTLRGEQLRLSRRLAPGYFDWPLEDQPGLLSLFTDAPLPVELLESCAILPKKSRTGLYGLQQTVLAAACRQSTALPPSDERRLEIA